MKIEKRLKTLISNQVGDKRRFAELEERSQIPSNSWKAMWQERQRPTLEMVEFAAKEWPDYAYWLVTGDTEPEHGHVAPPDDSVSYPVAPGKPLEWATAERLYKQRLLSNIPTDAQESTKLLETIRQAVFQVRERLVMPAVHMNFERIMKAQGSKPNDDLFLLEYDDELRDIRLKRWEEEKKLRETIAEERRNLGKGKILEKGLDWILKLFRLRK